MLGEMPRVESGGIPSLTCTNRVVLQLILGASTISIVMVYHSLVRAIRVRLGFVTFFLRDTTPNLCCFGCCELEVNFV